MKSKLLFEFVVDKEKNELTLRREFAADRQMVWDCYTQSELLDLWFAPSPLSVKTKSMVFQPGGHWHYVMIDPEGTEYWGLTEYITISPTVNYTAWDAFSNAEGTINPDLPRAAWDVSFSDLDDNAVVTTVVKYKSLQDLETVVQMGMEEGMMATLARLDTLLEEMTSGK